MKIDPYIFNIVYPIVQVEIFKHGYILQRKSRMKYKSEHEHKRGVVTHRSKRSLSKLAFLAANTSVVFSSIMTLTYPVAVPKEGDEVKAHLRRFLSKSKKRFGEYSYLWFLEFQKRGAPHYHILTTVKSPRRYHRMDFAKIWADIIVPENYKWEKPGTGQMFHVKHSDVTSVHSHATAWQKIRKIDGAKRYALKYALKPEQTLVPTEYRNVGRFWGHSSDVKPSGGVVVDVCGDEFVAALERDGNPCARFDIVPKHVIIRDT